MEEAFDLIRRFARSTLPVLITGETGVGKEHGARAVHQWSSRRKGRFIALNCAALPDALVESELFGHKKGTFTGAAYDKPGVLEVSGGGTLFLDEISELAADVQAKLLRVTETGCVTRLGEVTERHVDIRIVAATNCDLMRRVQQGLFRADLYYRLSVASVSLPPLRDRPEEILMLAQMFADSACEALGRPPLELSAEAIAVLLNHTWPGNVRELKNVMGCVAAAIQHPAILPEHLAAHMNGSPVPSGSFDQPVACDPPAFRPLAEEIRELERRRIIEAMAAADGVQTKAARLIEVPLRTFVHKLRKYGLTPAGRSVRLGPARPVGANDRESPPSAVTSEIGRFCAANA